MFALDSPLCARNYQFYCVNQLTQLLEIYLTVQPIRLSTIRLGKPLHGKLMHCMNFNHYLNRGHFVVFLKRGQVRHQLPKR